MKKNIIIALSCILSISNLCAWNFKFSNVTERTLVICYKLAGLSQLYYQIIPSDSSVEYFFPNAHCFGGTIWWAEHKTEDSMGRKIPFAGGWDLVDETSGEILKNKQDDFRKYVANKYAFIPMQIKVVSDETFQATLEATEQFAKGLDGLACETISAVEKFVNPLSALGKNSQSGTGMGMVSDISNVMKNTMETATTLKDAGSSFKKFMNSNSDNDNSAQEPTITTAPSSIMPETPQENQRQDVINTPESSNQLNYNIPPSDMPSTPEEYQKLGLLDENFDKTPLLNELEMIREEARTKTTPSNQNETFNNINTNMGMTNSQPQNMGMNGTKPKNTCRFRLGKFLKGAANLAANTLCRDLHFVIVDTGEVGTPGGSNSRLKKPVLIAEISQGSF